MIQSALCAMSENSNLRRIKCSVVIGGATAFQLSFRAAAMANPRDTRGRNRNSTRRKMSNHEESPPEMGTDDATATIEHPELQTVGSLEIIGVVMLLGMVSDDHGRRLPVSATLCARFRGSIRMGRTRTQLIKLTDRSPS